MIVAFVAVTVLALYGFSTFSTTRRRACRAASLGGLSAAGGGP